jgi:hypothetical protein
MSVSAGFNHGLSITSTKESTSVGYSNLSTTTGALTEDNNLSWSWSNGSGDGQVNEWWTDSRTLSGSASEDIDLSGSLTGHHGDTVGFTNIKFLFIYNTSEDDQISVAPSPSNGWNAWGTGTFNIDTESPFYIVSKTAGYTVTPGSADSIRITNLGAESVTYHIAVVGVA